MAEAYDVVIVGGGVSGASLAYILREYTNVGKIVVLEKEEEIACVNSHRNNNSQTLHFGDIETNYTFEKAKSVKRSADLVKHFLIQHDKKKTVHSKYTKMVLAVGDTQV